MTVLRYEPMYFYILQVLPCNMFYDTVYMFLHRQGRFPASLPERSRVPTPRLRERQRHSSRDSAEDHEHCRHEGVSHTQRVPGTQREEETTAKTHPQLMNSINEHYPHEGSVMSSRVYLCVG